MAETSGPERYAPVDRRPTENRRDVEQIGLLRQQQGQAVPANAPTAENQLNALVQRVAGNSMEEIDRVIRALENVRDMMRKEGERVSREVAGYASLSHAATTAMQLIVDNIKQWKNASNKSGPRPES